VGVFQRNWRAYVGTLAPVEGGTNGKDHAELVVPMDIRIPKIRIRTRLAGQLVGHRFVRSLHVRVRVCVVVVCDCWRGHMETLQ